MAWYPIAPATASSVATLPAMVAAVICVVWSAISATPKEHIPYRCASPPAASRTARSTLTPRGTMHATAICAGNRATTGQTAAIRRR